MSEPRAIDDLRSLARAILHEGIDIELLSQMARAELRSGLDVVLKLYRETQGLK